MDIYPFFRINIIRCLSFSGLRADKQVHLARLQEAHRRRPGGEFPRVRCGPLHPLLPREAQRGVSGADQRGAVPRPDLQFQRPQHHRLCLPSGGVNRS